MELLSDASVLFLDEPTSGLDPATEGELMAQLNEMSRQGRTVVCTTHVLQRAYLFTKLCIMARGVVVALGPLNEVMKEFNITDSDKLDEIYKKLENRNYTVRAYDAAEEQRAASGDQVAALWDRSDESIGDEPMNYFTGGSLARVTAEGFEEIATIFGESGSSLWGDVVVVFENTPSDAQDFYDSLIRLHPHLKAKGGTLRLVNPPPALEKLVSQNRLRGLIRRYDRLKGALDDSQLGPPLEGRQNWMGLTPKMLVALIAAVVALIGGAVAILLLLAGGKG